MKLKYLTLSVVACLLFVFLFQSCSTTNKSATTALTEAQLQYFELPELKNNQKVIHYSGFSLIYDKQKKVPVWTAYSLTETQSKTKLVKRSNNFKTDEKVDPDLTDQDYFRSGYDRGHMVPANDMRWSQESMEDTFYMTNMAPQKHKLNAGIWQKLEAKISYWVKNYDKIYVVTGPVLTKSCLKMLANKICVPAEFYKVILRKKSNSMQAVAFVIPHEFNGSKTLIEYAKSVKEVEKITGINFFPALSEKDSAKIENDTHFQDWLN